jgi:hypothetical protein
LDALLTGLEYLVALGWFENCFSTHSGLVFPRPPAVEDFEEDTGALFAKLVANILLVEGQLKLKDVLLVQLSSAQRRVSCIPSYVSDKEHVTPSSSR